MRTDGTFIRSPRSDGIALAPSMRNVRRGSLAPNITATARTLGRWLPHIRRHNLVRPRKTMMRRNALWVAQSAFAVTLCMAIPEIPFLMSRTGTAFEAVRYPLLACWILILGVALYRWVSFTCPHCQQRFFFPVMNRPRFFVPSLLARHCANCHAQVEA